MDQFSGPRDGHPAGPTPTKTGPTAGGRSPPATVHNPWGYAGGYTDIKTGLIKYGARYYNPALYRWTQQDPMTGSSGNPLTTNRYIYAANSPVTDTDPAGTSVWSLTTLGLLLGIAGIALFGIGFFVLGADAGVILGELIAGSLELDGLSDLATEGLAISASGGILGVLGAVSWGLGEIF